MCRTLTMKVMSPWPVGVHWQFETFLEHVCHSPPPKIFFLPFRGGQGWQFPIPITVSASCCFLCMSHVSARPQNLVHRLSYVILRVLHSFALKSLLQVGKAIALSFMVLFSIVTVLQFQMTSWKKASVVVGLSGLTPREVVRGALTCPEFQNMPDPPDSDPFGPVVVKAEVRNILECIVLCTVIYGL